MEVDMGDTPWGMQMKYGQSLTKAKNHSRRDADLNRNWRIVGGGWGRTGAAEWKVLARFRGIGMGAAACGGGTDRRWDGSEDAGFR